MFLDVSITFTFGEFGYREQLKVNRQPKNQHLKTRNALPIPDRRKGIVFDLFPTMEAQNKTSSELHLIIIWQNALNKAPDILQDIAQKFQILEILNVQWTSSLFSSNLTRFYGENLPPNSHKEQHCGNGPFLLVILQDLAPIYESRMTSRGSETVNTNLFDAKDLYRKWTGGGHKIHATNSEKETNHDLTLLLGKNVADYLNSAPKQWNQGVNPWNHDLVGARGFTDFDQVFYVLNNTITYIVMRNFEGFPEELNSTEHLDVDLLTDKGKNLAYILNAEKLHQESYRVLHHVSIGGKKVLFDLRSLGDNYYDDVWTSDLLNSRILEKNFYRPEPTQYFYSLLYHGLIHKAKIAPDYIERLTKMAENLHLEGFSWELFRDKSQLVAFLSAFMQEKGYAFVEPNDFSVYYNWRLLHKPQVSVTRIEREPTSELQKVLDIISIQKNPHSDEAYSDLALLKSSSLRKHLSPLGPIIGDEIGELLQPKSAVILGAHTGNWIHSLLERLESAIIVEPDNNLRTILSARFSYLTHVKISQDIPQSNPDLVFLGIALDEKSQYNECNWSTTIGEIALRFPKATLSVVFYNTISLGVLSKKSQAQEMFENDGYPTYHEVTETLSKYYNHQKILHAFPYLDAPSIFCSENIGTVKSEAIGTWMGSYDYYSLGESSNEANTNRLRSALLANCGKLGESCGGFIILSSNNSLPCPAWDIKHKNGGSRRKEFRATTTLSNYPENPIVTKSGTPFHTPSIFFQPNEKRPFYEGKNGENDIILALSDNNLDALVTHIRSFMEVCEQYQNKQFILNYYSSEQDIFVHGRYFDAITRNHVIANGTWNAIDLEWQMRFPVPLSLLVYRTLSHLVVSMLENQIILTELIRNLNRLPFRDEIAVFLMHKLGFLGINQHTIAKYNQFEIRFQMVIHRGQFSQAWSLMELFLLPLHFISIGNISEAKTYHNILQEKYAGTEEEKSVTQILNSL